MTTKHMKLLLAFALLMLSAVVLTRFSYLKDSPVRIYYNYPKISSKPEKTVEKPLVEKESIAEETSTVDSWSQEESSQIAVVYFPLELNSATLEELMKIPKVGRVTGARIVQYREHIGGYKKLNQLLNIKGIGERTFEEITPYLYLYGDEWDSDS